MLFQQDFDTSLSFYSLLHHLLIFGFLHLQVINIHDPRNNEDAFFHEKQMGTRNAPAQNEIYQFLHKTNDSGSSELTQSPYVVKCSGTTLLCYFITDHLSYVS